MDYARLRRDFQPGLERTRVVSNLERLRAALDKQVPPKDQNSSLLMATWNVRDLGKDYLKGLVPGANRASMRRGAGPRLRETYYYIAEIISRFDFVAVQEVNDIEEWEIIHDILGRDWDYIATDVTDPRLGGNGERLLFAYDRRKVFFRKIAGEIVLPATMLISAVASADDKQDDGKQFRRTPFLTAFQAGWFKFDICTVHIYYGKASGPELQQRIGEIDAIAGYLAQYAEQALERAHTLFLLGDFNIVSPKHKTMEALKKHGFKSPGEAFFASNIAQTKHYDQIAYLSKAEGADFSGQSSVAECDFGTFRFFDHVFRDGDEADFAQAMTVSRQKKYRTWATYQMSDHMPLWVRLKVDDSAAYLAGLKQD